MAYTTAPAVPLILDLDGTLLEADSTCLLLRQALRHGDLRVFAALGRGKGYCKAYLTRTYPLDMAALPWNDDIVTLLREAQASRRPVWLATASDENLACREAASFQLSGFSGSTEQRLFKGEAKLAWLLQEFGPHRYDYAGDSACDIPLWRYCRTAYVSSRLPHIECVRQVCRDTRVFRVRRRFFSFP